MKTAKEKPPLKAGEKGVWSIGDPLCPMGHDDVFEDEAAARASARVTSNNDKIVAVWLGDVCVALYWGGCAWKQA